MQIIEVIFPVLAIALAGYLASRSGHLRQKDSDALGKLVFYYFIPALLFLSSAQADFPAELLWGFFIGYYAVAFSVYFCSAMVGKILFKYSPREQSVFGMGSAYSNLTIIGVPVCTYALGEASLVPLFVIISIHNLAMFSVGTLVAERDAWTRGSLGRDLGKMAKQMVIHPITASLIAGVSINLLGLTIYQPLEKALSIFGQAAVPAALFVLGTSLHRYQVKGQVLPVAVMVGMKMVIFPLALWFVLFQWLEMDPLWASTALVTAAMPVGIATYIFAQRYQACEATIASGIVLSTLFSALSLTLVLAYVQPLI